MLQLLTIGTLVFFGSSIINVILNTIKSIVTIKGSTRAAAIMNAVTFGFYTIVVKQISDFDLMVTVPITILANLFGVYLAKWILHFFQKDKLWRISCTISKKHYINTEVFKEKFDKYNIEYTIIPLDDYKSGYIIDIFSKTQGESELIKEIITTNNIKYTVYEIDKTL
jgi:capsule polysaccharide modification protein KpsS